MNNKILFADLDRTLLCDDKSISEEPGCNTENVRAWTLFCSGNRTTGRVRENCCERSWADQSGMLYDRL